jgi:hypothetical protein
VDPLLRFLAWHERHRVDDDPDGFPEVSTETAWQAGRADRFEEVEDLEAPLSPERIGDSPELRELVDLLMKMGREGRESGGEEGPEARPRGDFKTYTLA